MQPIVHGLENTYGEQIEFVKYNIDDPNSDAAKEQYGFRYQPYFILLNGNGEIVSQWNGAVTADEFEQAFAGVLQN